MFFGPWLTLAALYLALCGHRLALLFFTAGVGAALLPAQGVRPGGPAAWQQIERAR